jgi:hypothetical protein
MALTVGMSLLRTWIRRPVTWIVVGVLVVLGGAVGLALFQPWKLWVDDTVDEAAPAVALPSPSGSSPPAPAGPRVVASGDFITHEHGTTGRAVVLQLADGSRVLRLENLNTSNGPDLHVWITDAPVKQGTAGWRVFDDGEYTALGKLKGNKGSQNYALPASVNLAELNSVTIWCDRFNVSFGAAALTLA